VRRVSALSLLARTTEAFLTSFGVVRCRQDAFTLDVLEVPQGSGSGFVWDKSGHIVTNFHVIRGASDLRLVGSSYVGEPVASMLILLGLGVPRS
jgi:S1-C subfamily serine protease